MTDEKTTVPASSEPDSPIEKAIAADDRASRTGRLGWLGLVVAALFGLFYAYDEWEAIGNIIGVPAVYDSIGFSASTPWVLLYAALAFPVVIFVLMFAIGLRRNIGEKALLLLVGLAVSNALALSTIGLNSLIFSNLIDRL